MPIGGLTRSSRSRSWGPRLRAMHVIRPLRDEYSGHRAESGCRLVLPTSVLSIGRAHQSVVATEWVDCRHSSSMGESVVQTAMSRGPSSSFRSPGSALTPKPRSAMVLRGCSGWLVGRTASTDYATGLTASYTRVDRAASGITRSHGPDLFSPDIAVCVRLHCRWCAPSVARLRPIDAPSPRSGLT